MSDLLGKRIAALRSAKGLNQKQLAEKLNVSPSSVGMYEQGRREPSLELIVGMAEVLCVSIDFLLTGRPAAPEIDDRATYQKLIHDSLLPFGGKVCFAPCCKQYPPQISEP